MRIVCISDTHSLHNQVVLPEGDVLVHAGDLLNHGTLKELPSAAGWLDNQLGKFEDIVVIGGNHDFALEAFMREGREDILKKNFFPGIHYLRDEAVTIKGFKFYGSPWQPEFCDWAFNLPRGAQLAEKWAAIPADTDVLVTHGPPFLQRDWVGRDHVGCADLRLRVDDIKPKVHVFGHIHAGYGMNETDGVKFVNAALCNERYQIVNAPIVVEI
jgi:predicted phosphodiesterase